MRVSRADRTASWCLNYHSIFTPRNRRKTNIAAKVKIDDQRWKKSCKNFDLIMMLLWLPLKWDLLCDKRWRQQWRRKTVFVLNWNKSFINIVTVDSLDDCRFSYNIQSTTINEWPLMTCAVSFIRVNPI